MAQTGSDSVRQLIKECIDKNRTAADSSSEMVGALFNIALVVDGCRKAFLMESSNHPKDEWDELMALIDKIREQGIHLLTEEQPNRAHPRIFLYRDPELTATIQKAVVDDSETANVLGFHCVGDLAAAKHRSRMSKLVLMIDHNSDADNNDDDERQAVRETELVVEICLPSRTNTELLTAHRGKVECMDMLAKTYGLIGVRMAIEDHDDAIVRYRMLKHRDGEEYVLNNLGEYMNDIFNWTMEDVMPTLKCYKIYAALEKLLDDDAIDAAQILFANNRLFLIAVHALMASETEVIGALNRANIGNESRLTLIASLTSSIDNALYCALRKDIKDDPICRPKNK